MKLIIAFSFMLLSAAVFAQQPSPVDLVDPAKMAAKRIQENQQSTQAAAAAEQAKAPHRDVNQEPVAGQIEAPCKRGTSSIKFHGIDMNELRCQLQVAGEAVAQQAINMTAQIAQVRMLQSDLESAQQALEARAKEAEKLKADLDAKTKELEDLKAKPK